ncbi:uncharacterized protein LOC127701223 [Mytilus californianus]|uniref:uncharacterized protein LOC127701223 n=1 Tax=Mytilus californianus TaxID=6549 RepID=UPI00224689AD|nr:uncharacterized protein LOC127701223 [Mytilus californianus]
MTDAKLQSEAQTLIICQLCESNSTVRWKCIACDLLMCDTCTDKIHPKFKLAETHSIIPLKDIGTMIFPVMKLKRIPCRIHDNQTYCIFCQSCDQLVCPVCLSQSHQKHQFLQLEEILKKKIEKIKTFDAQIEYFILPFYQKESEKIEKYFMEVTEHFKDIKFKIATQEEKLITEIKIQKLGMTEELEGRMALIDNFITEKRNNIAKIIENSSVKRECLSDILKKARDVELLHETMKETEKWLSTVNDDTQIRMEDFPRLPSFEFATIKNETIAKLFGFLQCGVQISTKIKKTLSIGISRISKLTVNSRREDIWLSSGYSFETRKYAIHTDLKLLQKVEDKREYNIYDMAPTVNGDLLFTIIELDCYTYIATKDGIEQFRSFSPLFPRAVHISTKGVIYVSLRDNGPIFKTNDKGARKIVIVNFNDKIEIKRFGDKKMLTDVTRIKSDKNGCVYFIDLSSKKSDGRIIAMSPDGLTKWIYEGKIDTDNSFTPTDLVVTKEGKLIVSDMHNFMLHIIDSKGEFIQKLSLKTIGILNSLCIDIDNNDDLYIGCASDKKSPETSKLYVISVTMS